MADNTLNAANVTPVSETGAGDSLLAVCANGALRRVAAVNSAAVAVINAPANSAALTCQGGRLFTDGSFLYVSTANNTLMKVSLTTF